MKKIVILLTFLSVNSYAQEHFSGISTSKRGGILNTLNNPAELSNMNTKYEVNVFNFSLGLSNNKLTFNDLIKSDNIENKIFDGYESVNLRLDAMFVGPSFAFTHKKWGFGIFSVANIKANVINVDAQLGKTIQEGNLSALLSQTTIASNENQRINATTWGELGFSVARNIYDSPQHKINIGTNLRLLFPGGYANFAANNLNGTIVNAFGDVSLVNASASVNIAYAGALANDYNDQSNYNEFFSQGINGFAADIAINYQLKDENDNKNYKLNAGLAIKNIGGMTFKSDNNLNKTYNLNVENLENLDLNQFENVESFTDLEAILSNPANAAFFQTASNTNNVSAKLPTVINAYADVRLANKWFVTASINQKVTDDNADDIITAQNSYTVIPRFSGKWFEAYAPIAQNEISGFTTGIGFRLGGFFLGSNSIITALANSGKQADIYLGMRFGF